MSENNEMTTLSGVLETLRVRKMDTEFKWTEEGEGLTADKGKVYQPEDLEIIKTYRFEGASDPSDSSILYILRANDGLVGYSIDSYGAASNHEEGYNSFIRKVTIEGRENQLLVDL